MVSWFFSFLFIMLFVFTVEEAVVSWIGWEGFQFCVILQCQFFTLICRGTSWASVYKLTTGEVLKAPKTSLRPSW